MLVLQEPNLARRRWLVHGRVQGVGFRPFVYRAASQLALVGFVRNSTRGVVIEAQGRPDRLQEFEHCITTGHPPAAQIRAIKGDIIPAVSQEAQFRILHSDSSATACAEVMVDTAACPDCVREVLTSDDRRSGYPFTNCTQCGPRFSIIRRVPYDRPNTTMSGFGMCSRCEAEYSDPADRRFHAQPIACPECGPRIELIDRCGRVISGDPIRVSRELLLNGRIVAIKGLGGFHLAVRADDETAVLRLRRLKHRDHKPFALMVGSVEQMCACIKISENGLRVAQSPACPIVLAPRSAEAPIAQALVPGTHRLGVMLPYTPLHHLLFRGGFPALVMTSGNHSDEPLVFDNCDALARLAGLCDAVLWHDRPVERGIDDSVVIDIGEPDPIMIRRARGYAPASIPLADAVNPGLCVGGELKNTIAIVRDESAILSHHLGDLTDVRAFENFRRAIQDMGNLFEVSPQWIAHDLHPRYLSTVHARELARQLKVPLIPVQHHHAHSASVMAEHGICQTVLAIVCDGTGYGTDGTIWGGELLAADRCDFRRLARLKPLRLPGGDAAARDTRRCAAAMLFNGFGDKFVDSGSMRSLFEHEPARHFLARMIVNNASCTNSSGAGRLFDGVAALLGLCERNHHEAEAAMALESAASRSSGSLHSAKFYEIQTGDLTEIDFSPLVCELVSRIEQQHDVNDLAALFHEQFARAWCDVALRASTTCGIRTVALSGGVFCNELLTRRLTELLESNGLRVLRNQLVPPNDGGISLGQAAIASARLARKGGA
jgi:hydrogenase maturation protein HypF